MNIVKVEFPIKASMTSKAYATLLREAKEQHVTISGDRNKGTLMAIWEGTLPDGWDNLSLDQIQKIAHVQMILTDSDALIMACVIIATEMPEMIIMEINEEHIAYCFAEMQWLSIKPSWNTSKQPMLFKVLKAPNPGWADFTFGQFRYMDGMFKAYSQTDDLKSRRKILRDLFSVHYTLGPIPWNKPIAYAIAFFARFIPDERLAFTSIDMSAMWNSFQTQYPETFSSGNAEGSKFRDLGVNGIMVGVSGPKFGSPKMVRKAVMPELFTHLVQVAQNNSTS